MPVLKEKFQVLSSVDAWWKLSENKWNSFSELIFLREIDLYFTIFIEEIDAVLKRENCFAFSISLASILLWHAAEK